MGRPYKYSFAQHHRLCSRRRTTHPAPQDTLAQLSRGLRGRFISAVVFISRGSCCLRRGCHSKANRSFVERKSEPGSCDDQLLLRHSCHVNSRDLLSTPSLFKTRAGSEGNLGMANVPPSAPRIFFPIFIFSFVAGL